MRCAQTNNVLGMLFLSGARATIRAVARSGPHRLSCTLKFILEGGNWERGAQATS